MTWIIQPLNCIIVNLLKVYWLGPILGSLLACLLNYLVTNFPVITDEAMAVEGEGIDLELEVISDKHDYSEHDDHLSDKDMSSPIQPDSLRFDQMPTEMKTYMWADIS